MTGSRITDRVPAMFCKLTSPHRWLFLLCRLCKVWRAWLWTEVHSQFDTLQEFLTTLPTPKLILVWRMIKSLDPARSFRIWILEPPTTFEMLSPPSLLRTMSALQGFWKPWFLTALQGTHSLQKMSSTFSASTARKTLAPGLNVQQNSICRGAHIGWRTVSYTKSSVYTLTILTPSSCLQCCLRKTHSNIVRLVLLFTESPTLRP